MEGQGEGLDEMSDALAISDSGLCGRDREGDV